MPVKERPWWEVWLAKRGWSFAKDLPIGAQGELLAVRHLRRSGIKILETQAQAARGEIDIVALDRGTIVFVEVKTRRTKDVREALEAVDYRKQRQLTRLALAYLQSKGWLERASRFDVIGIAWQQDRDPDLKHVQNAFEAVGEGQMFC